MCVPRTVRFAQFVRNVKPMRLVSVISASSLINLFRFVSDKEYRKGVYWLETLRLRRSKILESAYTV